MGEKGSSSSMTLKEARGVELGWVRILPRNLGIWLEGWAKIHQGMGRL
jgi:hypothetical protein